jgi:hypothetical protein
MMDSDEGKGYVWEIIPTLKFNTGKLSLPSASERKTEGEAPLFAVEIENANKPGTYYQRWGVRAAIAAIRRQDTDSNYYYGTSAIPVNRRDPIFLPEEVPTPNMPESVLKVVREGALARQEAAWQRRSAARQAPASGGDMQFAEPNPEAEARSGLNGNM